MKPPRSSVWIGKQTHPGGTEGAQGTGTLTGGALGGSWLSKGASIHPWRERRGPHEEATEQGLGAGGWETVWAASKCTPSRGLALGFLRPSFWRPWFPDLRVRSIAVWPGPAAFSLCVLETW